MSDQKTLKKQFHDLKNQLGSFSMGLKLIKQKTSSGQNTDSLPEMMDTTLLKINELWKELKVDLDGPPT
ncbi:MAG: hypothetical protein ISR65_10445 [Bacteriovoracaceae bacterium]|nr:hypothetical protein [Bacteriovoracaceae bacterium]